MKRKKGKKKEKEKKSSENESRSHILCLASFRLYRVIENNYSFFIKRIDLNFIINGFKNSDVKGKPMATLDWTKG